MGKEAQKNLSVAAQTVSMAAAGAPLGPVGIAAGAVAGFTLGMLGKKTQKDAEKEQKRLAKIAEKRRSETEKDLAIATRAELSQATEDRNRAIKEGRRPPSPAFSTDDQSLAMALSAGPGTPYDQYIAASYGRPFVT